MIHPLSVTPTAQARGLLCKLHAEVKGVVDAYQRQQPEKGDTYPFRGAQNSLDLVPPELDVNSVSAEEEDLGEEVPTYTANVALRKSDDLRYEVLEEDLRLR